jgi:transposase
VEIIYERGAGIDVGKKEVAVTVRVPGKGSGAARVEVARKFKTFYGVLAVTATWLAEQGVTHVVMGSTGIYWRPLFFALCEADVDFEVLLVNAAHMKTVPGRKTDVKGSQWLARLLEVGLLRGSLILPAEIAAVREVTRYRKSLLVLRFRLPVDLVKAPG